MGNIQNENLLRELTISQMVSRSARIFGDSTALSAWKDSEFISITYKELENKVNLFAKRLNSLGVRKNDRLGLLSENRPEWGIAYPGILSSGGIAVPLDSLLRCSELELFIRDSKMKSLVTSSKYMAEIFEITKKISGFEFLELL